MKLYIGNSGRQKHLFNYKLPERMQPFSQDIPAGSQICLNVTKDEAEHIIAQHAPYGLTAVGKLARDFSGLFYSLDKEITAANIETGADKITEKLQGLSEEVRKGSVTAIDAKLAEAAASGGKQRKSGLKVEITGEPLNPEQDNAPHFSQTVEVKG